MSKEKTHSPSRDDSFNPGRLTLIYRLWAGFKSSGVLAQVIDSSTTIGHAPARSGCPPK